MSRIIAVVGGIGAGKSVVCNVLRAMGYRVYDSDLRARELMNASDNIKAFLVESIHPEAVDSRGCINRPKVAEVVFGNEEKRLLLNKAVHGAVRDDFERWCREHASIPVLFVECAILCESGLCEFVDRVWIVEAPRSVRIERVCQRNGLTEHQVSDRIEAQQNEDKAVRSLDHDIIANDNVHPILPRIEELLGVE